MSTPHAIRPQRTVPNARRVQAGVDASIRELARIRVAWLTAHAHAVDAIGGPGSSLGGSGHSSDISDPTGRQALADDPAAQYLARVAKRMDSLHRELRALADETTGWQVRRVADGERKPTSGAGTCAACARWVHGTAEDRIRSAYCEACYRAWMREGQPERARFEHSRRPANDDAGEAA
jgi:hypothetical protein